jgi:hypothetical protein
MAVLATPLTDDQIPLDAIEPIEAGPAPGSSRDPRSTSRRLLWRLPYVLAVLALGVGYLAGHTTNNPAPTASAQNNLVTPAQINAALTPSNGHAVENDRGFSLLENGVQHSHGIDLPVTPAQRKELARQMDLTRRTALEYPTLKDAERAGLVREGPFAPGIGLHMVNNADQGFVVRDTPITDDQITHPIAWIYDGTGPDARVVGLFYTSIAPNPEGFAGPNDVWHTHSNICAVPRADGGIDVPLGADRSIPKPACDAVGGYLFNTPPLLHVWTVPGYEDSQGVFAHLNPAVTCNDGTYHTIDETKIGNRVTVCADGTE